ncbi:hypothetical protein ZIOFF_044463 [Zingiber officinale]|uniref:CDPK-related kinase 3 n=1 Tax=Zingiber officinale TaxID=94328 RepID=A0A8J5FV93_ZINOF|nr:hypothetical protein ZIOFF_044463 [Zingiber officinale]
MGLCYGKNVSVAEGGDADKRRHGKGGEVTGSPSPATPASKSRTGGITPSHSSTSTASPYPQGFASPLPAGVSPSPARSTPRRFLRPFPPPSPAKHIRAAIAKRLGPPKPKEGPIPEDEAGEEETPLDKNFGYGKNFGAKYELGKEVGRGHFGHTCSATAKKGEIKGQLVAVKIISKAKVRWVKRDGGGGVENSAWPHILINYALGDTSAFDLDMTTPISIEDVRREVKILKALSNHNNLVKFYDACEDALNVYVVMEYTIGGRYSEEDAKAIVIQILSVIAFCHLQGVVHRDLKPEEQLRALCTDERLNDIVGSAYYVAPEVLHRSYSMEADIWSIGVITYILLCGSRPFWARTESGIFRAVLRADPNFVDSPWPDVSPEAKDFVKRLLNKDYRKRMTAAQSLTHPWLRDEHCQVPLDILIFKLVKSYLRATPLKRAALKALSKALTEDQLFYLRSQFKLLAPNGEGHISFDNFRMALLQNATEAMKESKVIDILNVLEPLSYRKMDFEEFCAAAISPHHLEALDGWEQMTSTAFEHFEREGNRAITVKELAQELSLPATNYSVLRSWIRPEDCKFNFLGYTRYLHGVTIRSANTRHR